jgi:hypothetical protein
MYTEMPNHEPSLFLMNLRASPSRPPFDALVADLSFGLENQNLPGFVVLCPGYPICRFSQR